MDITTMTTDNCTGFCTNVTVVNETDAWLFFPVITVLTAIGLGGNILCVVVFTRVKLENQGIRLLKLLSATDICFLVLCYTDLTLSDVSFNISRSEVVYGYLKPVVFPVTWTVRMFETFLTALISLQRALALTCPMTFDKYINRGTINKSLLLIGSLSVLFSIPNWIAYGPQLLFKREKSVLLSWITKNSFLYSVGYLHYFTFIFHCCIPLIILSICNITFIIARRKMATVIGMSRDKGSYKMTAIVVAITTVAAISHAVAGIGVLFPNIPHISSGVILSIVLKLSTNFIFYSMFGRSFRMTLGAMFRCKQQINKEEETTQNTGSACV